MNPLNFLQTTNYPQSFLEGTFGNKFYQNVVEPAKLGTGPKPTLGQVAKNWNPFKAFTPQMLATGPTKAASTFLKSSGIGTLAGLLFDATPANADEINMTAEDFQNLALQNQAQAIDPTGKNLFTQHGYEEDDEYDFSDIEGQTASLLNPVTKKMWDMLRIYNAAKKIKKHGPKVLKTIGTLTGGKTQAGDGNKGGGGYQDQGGYSTQGGFTGKADPTSGGVRGHHGDFAQGGRASYFDGGLASLWPR